MNKGLLQIAEGFAMVAEGYRKMASEGMEIPKDIQREEKPEKSSTPEKKISITEVRAVMAEKSRAGKTQEIKQLLKEFGADKLSFKYRKNDMKN